MTCTTCIVITCHGPSVMIVDRELIARPTRRYSPDRVGHILDELRTAAAQDRVRR
jgi:hypothetical protein